MLKKTRVKFICITMAAVVLALAAIMITANVTNYAQIDASADQLTKILANNDGKMPGQKARPGENVELPENPEDRGEPPQDLRPDEPDADGLPERFGKETTYDTRFFTVTVTDDATTTDLDRIASVDEETAIAMAQSVLKKGKSVGYYGEYRYRIAEKADGGKLVVFVEYSRQLTPAKTFLVTSCIVAAASVVALFILVFFLSKKVLQPVAESYARQKRFVTDAGHELKTPLTVISANNDLIQMTTGEEESTGVIRKQVARLTSMVNDLTTLAKLDESATCAFAPVPFSDAVADASDSLLSLYEKDGKILENFIEGGITVRGDSSLLDKLLMILLENAYKYSLTKTTVRLVKSGANAVLTIANDAEGVEKGDQERCFERFYRSAEARATKEGSGIGLSVAREIVALHKGKITAEGKDGGIFEIKVVL